MVIYEVSLEIDPVIFIEYSQWLADHIKKIIRLKGFQRAKSLEEIDLDKNTNITSIRKLIVQYEIDTMENLQVYFDLHASAMRKENDDKYGDQVRSSRKIYKANNFMITE